MSEYQRCNVCVMDNKGDDRIVFDEHGQCQYCAQARAAMPSVYFPGEEGRQKMERLLEGIREESKDREYDCIMGISGGLDSAYLAYLGAVKWNLRILAVHIDDGFDEPVAQNNVRKLCEKAGIHIHIKKPDAAQFNDLTKAFFRAGVPNLAIPQDNILFECLYGYARRYKMRHFLSGGNFALECILQLGNSHDSSDKRHIKAIHRQFGEGPINKLKLLSAQRKLWDKYVMDIRTLRPLDYIDYNRERAIRELYDYCGFEYYGSKHLENKLTKVIQVYYLYHKFGVDKRKSHLSSMIVSGQMARDEALALLEQPLYDQAEMERDIAVVLDTLGLPREEFDRIMREPPRSHADYPTSSFPKVRAAARRVLRPRRRPA